MKKLFMIVTSLLLLVSTGFAYDFTPTDLAIIDRLEQKVEEMLATKPVEQRARIIGALNILSQSPQFSPQMQSLCLELGTRIQNNSQTVNLGVYGNNNNVAINNINNQNSNNTTVNNYYQYNSNDNNSTNIVVNNGGGNGSNTGGTGTTGNNEEPPILSTLTVTRIDGFGSNRTIPPEVSDEKVYEIKASTTQGDGVNISRLILDLAGNGNYLNNGYLTLYINNDAIRTSTIRSNQIIFDGFNTRIRQGQDTIFSVRVTFSSEFTAGTFQPRLHNLDAYDSSSSEAITNYEKPTGAVFEVRQSVQATAVLNSSSANPTSQLFLSPAVDQKLLAFDITVQGDDARIYDLEFNGTNLNKMNNFRLFDSEMTEIATATEYNSTTVKFKTLSNAPYISKNTPETYYLVANINTNTNGSIQASVDKGTSKLINGASKDFIVNPTISNNHTISENSMVIAKASNPSRNLNSSALIFTVTADGRDGVTLSRLDFNNSFAGYNLSNAKIVLYKNSVSAGNKLGEKYFNNNGILSLDGLSNNTIDAGSTERYIVVIENAFENGSYTDWSISLRDVVFKSAGYGYDYYKVSDYSNLGDLPITETK